MLRPSPICIDASLIVQAVISAEPVEVIERWRNWGDEGRQLVASILIRHEVTNALHRLVRAGELTREDGERALRVALHNPMTLHADDDLHLRALEFAARFNLPAAYDAKYLALADKLGAEFWTAGRRARSSVISIACGLRSSRSSSGYESWATQRL